jgi:dynein heavy chain
LDIKVESFVSDCLPEPPTPRRRPYLQVPNIDELLSKIREYLDDFNEGNKTPMKLVMFLDACDHVSRISRVLRQP